MVFAFQFQSPGATIGSLPLRWYGLLIAIAVLVGVNLSQSLARKRDVNPDLITDISIWIILAGIICARLYYVAFEWQQYAQRPEDIIAIWKGGIAIHGALIGGTVAALVFAKINRVSFWQFADLFAPSVALGQAIGRWGNFFNSEAFGKPTDLPWKLYIPYANRPIEYVNYEYFHPTFLYESIWNLLVSGMLIYLFFWGLKNREKLKLGTIALIYLIAYSAGRIWIEGLRTDSLMLGNLKIAQLVSVLGISFGFLGLIWLYWYKRNLPDVVGSNSDLTAPTFPEEK
jgi:phosphatidylglycerol:prolipoprotein diacylglycerol transferase